MARRLRAGEWRVGEIARHANESDVREAGVSRAAIAAVTRGAADLFRPVSGVEALDACVANETFLGATTHDRRLHDGIGDDLLIRRPITALRRARRAGEH